MAGDESLFAKADKLRNRWLYDCYKQETLLRS